MKTNIKLFSIMLCLFAIAWACKKPEEKTPVVQTPTKPNETTKSGAKDITKFTFAALSPSLDATIDATAKTISTTVTSITDLTKLVPTITFSDKATIAPATGVAQDFSKEVSYTVTAEDGSTQVYKVNVKKEEVEVVSKIINSSNIPEILEDLGEGVDYIVKTNITIDGTKVITIKPGVYIQFEGGEAGFTVSSQAALKMIGTTIKPILLEGKVPSPGAWKGIEIHRAKNIENQWEYVTVRHAGGGTNNAGLFITGIDDAIRISLKNCTFSDNTGYGIIQTDNYGKGNVVFTNFQNNTFKNNTKSALKINFSQMGSLDIESKYAENGQKYIDCFDENFGNVNEDMNIKKIDVPFRVSGIISPKGILKIEPGVEIQFTTDAGIFINDYLKNATIIADGTASNPIKLLSYLPNTKGVWAGINAQNNNPSLKLNYCIIDGAGSVEFSCQPKTSKAAVYLGLEYYCIEKSGKGTITNCTISNSGGYGIAYRDGDAVTTKDIIFKDNTKENFYLFK